MNENDINNLQAQAQYRAAVQSAPIPQQSLPGLKAQGEMLESQFSNVFRAIFLLSDGLGYGSSLGASGQAAGEKSKIDPLEEVALPLRRLSARVPEAVKRLRYVQARLGLSDDAQDTEQGADHRLAGYAGNANLPKGTGIPEGNRYWKNLRTGKFMVEIDSMEALAGVSNGNLTYEGVLDPNNA